MKKIPPWLRKIIDETETPAACKKAVWRVVKSEWDAKHPRKPEKRGTKALTLAQMHTAVGKVLRDLKPQRGRIPYARFQRNVQIALGNSPTKKRDGTYSLYELSTVRPVLKEYLATVYWPTQAPVHLNKRRYSSLYRFLRPDDI